MAGGGGACSNISSLKWDCTRKTHKRIFHFPSFTSRPKIHKKNQQLQFPTFQKQNKKTTNAEKENFQEQRAIYNILEDIGVAFLRQGPLDINMSLH